MYIHGIIKNKPECTVTLRSGDISDIRYFSSCTKSLTALCVKMSITSAEILLFCWDLSFFPLRFIANNSEVYWHQEYLDIPLKIIMAKLLTGDKTFWQVLLSRSNFSRQIFPPFSCTSKFFFIQSQNSLKNCLHWNPGVSSTKIILN